MISIKILALIAILSIGKSCSRENLEPKGFSVKTETETEEGAKIDGIANDSLKLETRPSSVLLTGIPQYRLTTIYKVNYDKRNKMPFIGSNEYYSNYQELGYNEGNQWHNNFMPGIEAVYGYNMVNVSLFDHVYHTRTDLFEKPVLIRTVYFPSFSKDTLYRKAIHRNYYMISVYDDDTNRDGYINMEDLRHFYHFDITGKTKTPMIPMNYSVLSSEYDAGNDFMYVFAKNDANNNGKTEDGEEIHVFWIDLNNPLNNGREY